MLSNRPHFLGIGPSRSGTSWLYRVLRQSPSVWMPPIKELHYWDWVDRGKRTGGHRWHRHLDWRTRVNARATLQRLRAGPTPAAVDLAFDLRYFTGVRSPGWYRRVFSAAPADAVCGEITPAYASVSPATAARMVAELPGVRLVVFLRHPAERRWSSMVKTLARDRGRRVDQVPEGEWLAKARLGPHLDAVIRMWWNLVGTDRLHLAWFDELVIRPEEHLAGILGFLGLGDQPEALTARVTGLVNPASAGGPPPPPAVQERLGAQATRDIDRLADLFPEVPWVRAWQREPAGRW